MIDMNETTTETRKTRYRTQTPDSTQVTGDVGEVHATITYGGTTLVIPLDALPSVVALAATMSAAMPPVQTEPDPDPEETPEEEAPVEEEPEP